MCPSLWPETDDIILEQLASSYSILTEDEKDLGVCIVDIGGGTTDIAIFTEGAIQHTAVIPIAGDQVTNDIAVALRTPTQQVKYACALRQLTNLEDTLKCLVSVTDNHDSYLDRHWLKLWNLVTKIIHINLCRVRTQRLR